MKIIIETREGDIENPSLEVQMQSNTPILRIYPTKAGAQEESQRRVDACTRIKEVDIGRMIRTLEDRPSYLKALRESRSGPIESNL